MRNRAKQKGEGSGIAQAMGPNAQAAVHFGVPPEQVERMVLAATQRDSSESLPISVPPLPPNFVARPEALEALLGKMLDSGDSQRQTIALTAVAGMGGIGKTVLAQALCRDERVKKAFPDGIFWQAIGKESTIRMDHRMRAVVEALQDPVGNLLKKQRSAIDEYRALMASKAVLLVVDDVWRVQDIEPWLTESARSRVLFTTRNSSIADSVGAQQHWADLLTLEQSRMMFVRWAGGDREKLPMQAEQIIGECRQLPLALAMVGAMLRGKHDDLWQRTLKLLRTADLERIKAQFPNYPHPSLYVAMKVSVDALEPSEQARYCDLAILLEDMAAPACFNKFCGALMEAKLQKWQRSL